MTEGNKIRVLIVDDVADTRENIRKLLQFEKDVEVVGAASSGRDGITLAKEVRPDVVLMDINMPDMDGITATEQILKSNPTSQIVILSVQGDPNYMRRAMLAGARDFLTKPPAVDELTAAIRRAGKMAHEERKRVGTQLPGVASGAHGAPLSVGRVITVYSPKGGTGATMVAVNLAVALQSEESRVALLDANLQFGDVTVFMNEQVRNSILDLAPRAEELDEEVVEEVMRTHAASGVRILCAPPRPEYSEQVTGDQFTKIVQYLRNRFSYVVIDSSSYLTDIALAALDTSDLIVLITTQDIPSIKNSRLFLDLAGVLGINRKRILFIMNRFDKRIGITPEKVGESFKHEIVAVIPFEERIIVPSVNRGVPFMLGDRSRPIAKSFLTLVEVIRQRLIDLAAQEAEKAQVPARR